MDRLEKKEKKLEGNTIFRLVTYIISFGIIVLLLTWVVVQSRELQNARDGETELAQRIATANGIITDLEHSLDSEQSRIERDSRIIDELRGNLQQSENNNRQSEENNRRLKKTNQRLADFKQRAEEAEQKGQGIIEQLKERIERITEGIRAIPESTEEETSDSIF